MTCSAYLLGATSVQRNMQLIASASVAQNSTGRLSCVRIDDSEEIPSEIDFDQHFTGLAE